MGGLVALTGATGFLGRHIATRLRADGWRIRGLARDSSALDGHQDLEVIEGDLANRDALVRLVDGADVVVHCAGLTRGVRASAFHAVNVVGTATLAAAVSETTPRPRFVLISSLAAREPDISPYAASKRAAEDALRQLGCDLDWTVLRPAVIYGPGDTATLPLFKLCKRGLLFFPNLARRADVRVSLIYVEDVARAVAALLNDGTFNGGVFELRDDQPGGHTWQAIAANGGLALGTRVRRIPISRATMAVAASANSIVARLIGESPLITTGKVREIFHADWGVAELAFSAYAVWRPEVSIGEGFTRTARWYRQQNLL